MIIKHKETVKSNFKGTVIDIETIGSFRDQYRNSRRYEEIRMVILGFIDRNALEIFCAEDERSIDELIGETRKIINGLERPFYAFNSEFERGVFFYNLGMKVDFDGELQRGRESKGVARKKLGIPNYDDPFFDDGYRCMIAWQNREFDKAIAHNRACLLKERDILLKRGSAKPSELEFV
ncbi:MAG: hypothetical protein WBC55_07075 [Dehalococcoidia bacterium]